MADLAMVAFKADTLPTNEVRIMKVVETGILNLVRISKITGAAVWR